MWFFGSPPGHSILVRFVEVVRMQKMFGLLAQRFAEKFSVQGLYVRVFMRFAQRLSRVFLVQGVGSGIQHF